MSPHVSCNQTAGRRRAARCRALRFEQVEVRCVLSADPWMLIAGSDPGGPPLAEPMVVPVSGDDSTDPLALLAAGGPGDPNLPGWYNVGRGSDNITSVVYLGNGWALTANHVPTTTPVRFGATLYDVQPGSSQQLRNDDGSLADVKVFRLLNPPDLPSILPDMLAPEPLTRGEPLYMIGNGLSRGTAHYWKVNSSTNPWTWTEQAPPIFPNPNDVAGFDVIAPRTIRWGQNAVDDPEEFVQVSGSTYVQGFTTRLDHLSYTHQAAFPFEAQASLGDSGGPVFSLTGGQWVLSGIMIAVNQPLSGQPANTIFYGSITLMADLNYYRDQIFEIIAPAAIAGRHVVYNNSSFDGNTSAPGATDDAAIAPDKTPYFAGSGVATFENITGYSRGINGIVVDVQNAFGTLTATDFRFKVGSNLDPETWTDAPAPQAVLTRPGAGVGGSDRVEITWADGAIANTWLQVIVEGNDELGGFNDDTGLPVSDVFYFGNRIGDAGSGSPVAAITNATDEIEARLHPGFGVTITNIYDFDRSGTVNATDQIIARTNGGFLLKLDLPVAAIEVLPAAADAISSALASGLKPSRLDEQSTPPLREAVGEIAVPPEVRERAPQLLAAEDSHDELTGDRSNGDGHPFEQLFKRLSNRRGR